MTRTPSLQRSWLPIIALFFLLIAALAPPVAHAQVSDQQMTTRYFVIYYPSGEKETADWYAGFADDVNEAVSELLGSDPIPGIELTVYTSEAEYRRANPIAEVHPGVLAHAIPEAKQIGVAVERLRQLDPVLARDSFRHEMTHIIAGALSGQNLPIGFQEGIAQYNELSTGRSQDVVAEIKNAQDRGVKLLTWEELNDTRLFRRSMDIGYPEAYSMMAFLADRYGMGAFARFLERLDNGESYQDALFIAYGHNIADLEAEWNEYLPGFLQDGWRTNVLAAYDMAPAVALYDAGQFAAARDSFASSERLYRDLGRTDRAAEASGYWGKADRAQKADEKATNARVALEAHDYDTALRDAQAAQSAFAALQLTSFQQSADATATLAQQGLDAVALLASAQGRAGRFDFGGAGTEARQAATAFAALGDEARMAQASELVATLSGGQRIIALLLLGTGVVALIIGGVAVMITMRRRNRRPAPVYIGEENASWL